MGVKIEEREAGKAPMWQAVCYDPDCEWVGLVREPGYLDILVRTEDGVERVSRDPQSEAQEDARLHKEDTGHSAVAKIVG